jgi:non-heme chloroperoxidase
MGYQIMVEPGVQVYVEDLNPQGARTILFLHGWPLNGNAYEYQLEHLPKMGFRCLVMDTRGFGRSDRPWGGYDYNRLADDVRVVIDTFGLENVTLAGHSMGGAIAIRYMARHGGHGVGKLALFGAAAPSFVRRPDFPYGQTRDEVNTLLEMGYNNRPSLLRTFGSLFFYQYVRSALEDWFYDLGLEAAGWATMQCLVTLRDSTLFGDMNRIRVPTLILHGVHDRVCPIELGQTQHQGIRTSVLVPFEESGHGLFYEQREKFNSEFAGFASQ